MLNVLNPATGESIAEVPVATADAVDQAVATARGAFGTWSNTTPAERQEALLKLADAVEAHADELAELESRNAGKPLAAVKADELPPPSTTCASSPAPRAAWRARPRASTSRATRR